MPWTLSIEHHGTHSIMRFEMLNSTPFKGSGWTMCCVWASQTRCLASNFELHQMSVAPYAFAV